VNEVLILKELDKERLEKNTIIELDLDYINYECKTSFKKVLISTLIQTIAKILQKDGYVLQDFKEEELEKMFNAFMENTEIIVRLNKGLESKTVIIKFDISQDERKKLSEIYLDNIIKSRSYFYGCIVNNLPNKDINLISRVLSNQVYEFLTPDEVKQKIKDKKGGEFNE